MRALAPLFVAFSFPLLAAADPCPHPYLPLKSGATWTYHVGAGADQLTLVLRVESVRPEAGGQYAVIATHLTDRKDRVLTDVRQQYRCSSDGVHTEPPLGNATGPNGMAVEVSVKERSGVTLPPADGLRNGSEWNEGFVLKVGVPGSAPTQIVRNAHLRVVGRETLRVEAGSYEALHVESHETFKMPFDDLPRERRVQIWYGRGVGMIRTEADEGTIELVKFQPGQ